MSTPSSNVKLYTNTGRQITALENAFISEYVQCKNATQAAYNAGYKAKDMAYKRWNFKIPGGKIEWKVQHL